MPKMSLPLTDFKIRSLKTREKPYKISDGHGPYIFVSTSGEKIWRFDYNYETHKTLTIGSYPNVGIQEARNCLQIAKNDLKNGLDPMAKKKAIKTVKASAFTQDSFESIAREFIELHKSSIAPKQHERNIQMAETRLFPILGVRPIKTIKAIDILTILRDIENQGYLNTVAKLKSLLNQIFRYAIITNRGKRFNVLGALDFLTKKVTTITNDSYIRAAEVCDLLWKIALEYKGKVVYIVFDNTSYQKCNEVQNFAAKLKINLIFIPLYSPNLNLIERF